ncbi:MAG: hypothetical protein US62_C0012G0014 [Candidatus Woesebacteria bacterium GW2011_GWA1_37_8]|uniref:Glutamine amidotransferase domain-containing protein n=2 Tax=Candidatus Woeseibacteriota TaxID=1752722 RepID=A0A0G0LFV7_9BACT|nr:MAG: Glutamine amidotransferase class-I [Microgenomates group bacterium GW2011_GWC1_37_12b]KKQ45600.1 MAG: hypothetical protein US62_C0012G0014 [Candidatus Woesebacteria bacterium GW2011_GWA1_37_8]KKQ86820.1 MAG: hypothetical protein UT10_C0016G0014 [Candidatus Woesebacteria bacterium GW2011_GWB1_38_8b]
MHESFEAPAAIETWAKSNGVEVSYTKLYQGDQFPDNAKGFDFLVVMGGPQSPATTVKECTYFDAKKEIQFIKSAIVNNKILLGVCLGAQLIGEALGANFDHSPNREIGVFDLYLTESGKKDPIFSTFPDKFPVSHWHGDMPGLTVDSEILAYSKGCPRQIVKYSPQIYGFQCHFEFTPESVEGMVKNCAKELDEYKSLTYIENTKTLQSHDFNQMNALLFDFLDYITSANNIS